MIPWYDTHRGNVIFRRYFWAFMLGLSIANALSELRELWRVEEDREVERAQRGG